MPDHFDRFSGEKLISEFNEAKFQIFRLHNIWVECKYCREHGNLLGWKWKLDTAMIELWNDAKRTSKNTTEALKSLSKEINLAIKNKYLEEAYDKLIKKEVLLREIQEEAGKGAKFRAVDEDFM